MRIFPLFIFLLFSSTAFSQTSETKYPDFSGETRSEVLKNKNWEILKQAEGNLNSDSKKDLVLVIQSRDSLMEKRCANCKRVNKKTRIILVFISKQGKPTVISQNNTFIARADEGGSLQNLEPHISVENGQLIIFYQFVRGNARYNFEYKDEAMFLVKAKKVGVAGSMIHINEFDFKKKEIRYEQDKIGTDSTTTETIPIKFNGYKKLSELETMNDWEVVEYKYL